MVQKTYIIGTKPNNLQELITKNISNIKGVVLSVENDTINWIYKYGKQQINCITKVSGNKLKTTAQNNGDTVLGEGIVINKFYNSLSEVLEIYPEKKLQLKANPKHYNSNKSSYSVNKIAIIGAVIFIIFVYFISNREEKLPDYVVSIEKYKDIPKINLSIDVKISKRLNEKELEELGNRIYKKYNGVDYERVFIDYLYKGMTDGNGAYATTHFNPNLKIVLYGLSKEDINNIKSSGFSNKRYWVDDGWGNILTITKENNQFYMSRYFKNLEIDKKKLEVYIKNRDTLYEIKDRIGGEYYKINSFGELEQYDNQGIVYTMIKDE